MRKSKLNLFPLLGLSIFTLVSAQPVFGQQGRIAPEYIEKWFTDRIVFVLIGGAIGGYLVTKLWLPCLLPTPHKNDVQRARKHFGIALLLMLLLLAGFLLFDISVLYPFGDRRYSFMESFSQVWLTWRTVRMLLFGALSFTVLVAFRTRLLGSKFYRYMLILW